VRTDDGAEEEGEYRRIGRKGQREGQGRGGLLQLLRRDSKQKHTHNYMHACTFTYSWFCEATYQKGHQ
jgi:hypothetical protein